MSSISGNPISGIVSGGSISGIVSGGSISGVISGVVLAVSVPVQISVGSVSGPVVANVGRSVGRRSGVAAIAGAAVHVVSGIVVVGLGAGEDGTQYNQGKLHRELIYFRS